MKLLIYGLRTFLTANLLAKTKAYTVRLEDIYNYYPDTTLRDLVTAKKNRQQIDDVTEVYAEIGRLKVGILPLIKNFPKEVSPKDKEFLTDFLVTVRLQYMFSKNWRYQ